MPRRNRPEEIIHRQIVEWLQWAHPDLLVFHPYNGGYRTKAEAGIGKALGVKAGTPDLVFVLPGGKCAFMEIKAPKKYLTKVQKEFAFKAANLGARFATVRSFEEGQAWVEELVP